MDWVNSILEAEFAGERIGDLVSLVVIADAARDVLGALTIIVVGYLIAGASSRRIRSLGLRFDYLDPTLFNFMASITRYAIITFSILFVLNSFGVQTTSIIAVIGAAGLAIGLALQGILSNIAAGVMIVLFRPFKLGDFVEVAGQMGTVKDITLNFVELATIGNLQVIVANSDVWGNIITNYSAYPLRRAEWEFGVGYGADLDRAETIIRETIMSDPRSLSDPEPFIQVNSLNASSVDFLVRVWVKADVFFAYQADMKRAVKQALDTGGIDIPFPTRTVVIQKTGEDAV